MKSMKFRWLRAYLATNRETLGDIGYAIIMVIELLDYYRDDWLNSDAVTRE